ncbi:hypothetical protein, partial [Candidatus Binatus sp.]|uniref:hypothetical protein n=1 Tax=Candidatus Binatus sp. TaxID=2811406 RepID=UPI003F9C4494
ALDFEQVLRFFGNFRHHRNTNLTIVTKSDTPMQFSGCETRRGFAGVTPAPSEKRRCGTASLLEGM